MKARIQSQKTLDGYDCNHTGSKNTECTWGACDQSAEMWPDSEDHIWPHWHKTQNRIAPLGPPQSHWCPLDRRAGETFNPEDMNHLQGCFGSCRFFNPQAGEPELTQEYVLSQYEEALRRPETDGTRTLVPDKYSTLTIVAQQWHGEAPKLTSLDEVGKPPER